MPERVLAARDGVHFGRRSTGEIDERDDVAAAKSDTQGFSDPRQLPQLPQLSERHVQTHEGSMRSFAWITASAICHECTWRLGC